MERASTARLHLMKNGVEAKRIKRIIAYGPSEPANPDDIFDPKNRRINIILLNQEEKNLEEKSPGEKNLKKSSHWSLQAIFLSLFYFQSSVLGAGHFL